MNRKGWLGLNGTTPAPVTTGFHSSGSLSIGDIWTLNGARTLEQARLVGGYCIVNGNHSGVYCSSAHRVICATIVKPRAPQVGAPSGFSDRHSIQIQPMNVATKNG